MEDELKKQIENLSKQYADLLREFLDFRAEVKAENDRLRSLIIARTNKLDPNYETQAYNILTMQDSYCMPLEHLWKQMRLKSDPSRDLTGTDGAARKRRSRIYIQLKSRPDVFRIYNGTKKEMIGLNRD